MPATKNSDGSVSMVVNGASVTLTAADVSAINNAQLPPAEKRPLTIVTGSGRQYGKTGTARFGIFYKNGAWHYLDKYGAVIPGTSWKPRNLNRAKFSFSS